MVRFSLMVAAALIGFAGSVSAATTYRLTNVQTPTNLRDGGIVDYVDLHAPITFQFTVTSALAASNAFDWNGSNVVSWMATAGKNTSTISSDTAIYPDESLSRLWITTDAAGNIATWNILAKATNPAIASQDATSPEFYWLNVGTGPFTTVRFIDNHTAQSIGGARCSSECAQQFVQSDSTNTVPEPATWMMLISGFGLLGGALRTRRAATSALPSIA